MSQEASVVGGSLFQPPMPPQHMENSTLPFTLSSPFLSLTLLLLSELSLVRFEGVSEERRAGWLTGRLGVYVCLTVYTCAAGGTVKGRDREAG